LNQKRDKKSVWNYPRPLKLEPTNKHSKSFSAAKLLPGRIARFAFWKRTIRHQFDDCRIKLCFFRRNYGKPARDLKLQLQFSARR